MAPVLPSWERLFKAGTRTDPRNSREPVPRRLARHAERLPNRGPAHVARTQRVDRLLQARTRAVEDDTLNLQQVEQPVGRHGRDVLEPGHRRRIIGRLADDLVTESNAFVADEHARTGDELRHVVLALAAERAMERRMQSLAPRPRQTGRRIPEPALESHGATRVKASLTVKLILTPLSRFP